MKNEKEAQSWCSGEGETLNYWLLTGFNEHILGCIKGVGWLMLIEENSEMCASLKGTLRNSGKKGRSISSDKELIQKS